MNEIRYQEKSKAGQLCATLVESYLGLRDSGDQLGSIPKVILVCFGQKFKTWRPQLVKRR